MIKDYWSIITFIVTTNYQNHNHTPDSTTLPQGLAHDGGQCVQSRFSTDQRLEQDLEGLRRRVPATTAMANTATTAIIATANSNSGSVTELIGAFQVPSHFVVYFRQLKSTALIWNISWWDQLEHNLPVFPSGHRWLKEKGKPTLLMWRLSVSCLVSRERESGQ